MSNNNKAQILSTDEKVDTTSFGEEKLTIRYHDGVEEKEKNFQIAVIDTTIPSIECKEDLSTTVGVAIDLLEDVIVFDNSKEEIKAKVEGIYDFHKEGVYKLKYVAQDSSYNKAEKEFILTVNKRKQ